MNTCREWKTSRYLVLTRKINQQLAAVDICVIVYKHFVGVLKT